MNKKYLLKHIGQGIKKVFKKGAKCNHFAMVFNQNSTDARFEMYTAPVKDLHEEHAVVAYVTLSKEDAIESLERWLQALKTNGETIE